MELHLLPAAELPLWHAALAVSPRYLRPKAWENYLGITMQQLDEITEAIGIALDGRVLTREELAHEVGRLIGSSLGVKLAQGSWGTILKPAAFTGRLCFGPSVGQRVRFTRPSTWLSCNAPAMDTHTAQAAITRRFLMAYGPATHYDLARWWNGGGVAVARQWIASLGDEVTQVEVDGLKAWILTTDARELREFSPGHSVRLLPGFDQYVVGASWHASHLLPAELRSRIYRPQGWISPVLLVNGRMLGVWRHEIKGSRVQVDINPFCQNFRIGQTRRQRRSRAPGRVPKLQVGTEVEDVVQRCNCSKPRQLTEREGVPAYPRGQGAAFNSTLTS